ncbi:MAG: DUF5394 family protein [Rickettsiales bacterium]
MSTQNSNVFQNRFDKSASASPANDLANLFELADQLKKAISANDQDKIKSFESSKQFLSVLLEYLILNMDSMHFDQSLIAFLQRFLGLEEKKDKEGDKEEEKEDQPWSGLDEKEKRRRINFWVYAMYKALSPNRLAGETALENFVSNVKTRGVKVALDYDTSSIAKKFEKKDLAKLELGQASFVGALKSAGERGGGLGK